MSDCEHLEFVADVEVHRIGDAKPALTFVAELKVRCSACGTPFRFLGVPTGLSFAHPAVDIPATTLHAPIAPGERTEVPSQIKFEVA